MYQSFINAVQTHGNVTKLENLPSEPNLRTHFIKPSVEGKRPPVESLAPTPGPVTTEPCALRGGGTEVSRELRPTAAGVRPLHPSRGGERASRGGARGQGAIGQQGRFEGLTSSSVGPDRESGESSSSDCWRRRPGGSEPSALSLLSRG